MKNKLLFTFGIISGWTMMSAQVPEYLYYRFNDSASIFNYASDPQGNQNIPVPSNLYIDTIGFMGSNSLSGNADPATGGVRTGFYPDYSKSFTIAFWYANERHNELTCYYLFGDSLAGYHCIYTASGSLGMLNIYGEGGLEYNLSILNNPSQGAMFHIVYDATPTLEGPYGTYNMYNNGRTLVEYPVTSPPYNVSSGISIGSAPISIYDIQSTCAEVQEDMGGKLDEFRWYDRALTTTEIMNTLSSGLLPLGECTSYSHFSIDSISGESAKVNWTPGTGNDAFFLEYGPAGFARGDGILISGNYGTEQPPFILNGLAEATEYDVYFGEYCNGGTDSIYDPQPVTFKTTPLCPTPVEIEIISGIGTMEVDWEHRGPLNEYYITYGPVGFDPLTAGTRDTVSSLPYQVGGLLPGTRYDVYVETNCGTTYGNSIQVKRSIATECEIKIAPYFEDFNDSTWVAGSSSSAYGDTLNVCWSRSGIGRYAWKVREVSNYGPVLGRGGSGKFLATPHFISVPSLSSFGQEWEIYSPIINIGNLSNPYVSFYYHRVYFNNRPEEAQPDFTLEVNDGDGWEELIHLERYVQTDRHDPYQKIGADLSSYRDTIQIRLVARCIADNALVMGFDDLSIDEAPYCPADIFDVFVKDYGADTSLVLSVNSYASNYEIEWGSGDFEQGTGCTKVSSSPITLDSCVQVNTNVNVYLKDCQSTTWSGPFEVCGPRTAPYFNDFSGEDTLVKKVPCWDIYSSGKGATGDVVYSENNRTRSFSGSNTLCLFNGYQEADDTLLAITPAFIDLPEGGKQIRFMAFYAEGAPLDNNHLLIGTMSDIFNGASFKPIDTLRLKQEWNEYAVKFDPGSSLYNGSDNRIAFKAGNGLKLIYIDDFYYEEIPSCPAPLQASLDVNDEWYDAATTSWDKNTTAQSRVSWGVKGFIPGGSSESGSALVGGTSYRIQGLSPNTSYEFYVQSDCGATDKSDWIGPYSFTTLCTPVSTPFIESFDGSTWTPAPPIDGSGPFGPLPNWSNRKDILDPCWRRNIITGKLRSTGPSNRQNFYHTWGVTEQSVYKHLGTVQSGPVTDHSGAGSYIFPIPRAGIDLGNNIPDTADIYLPLIDISPLNNPYMSFFYHRFTVENNMPDVLIQANDGSGWVTLDMLKGIQQSAAMAPFYQKGISLAGLGDTVRIRFRSLFIGAPDLERELINQNGVSAIDNIEIKEAPPCFEPFDLTASQEIDTSTGQWNMNLSWSNSNVSANGFQVTYGPSGSNPDSLTASGKMFTTQDTNLSIDTLSAGCYEFFVRSICVSGDTSNFSAPLRFCINCNPLQAPLLETFNLVKSYESDMLPCWNRTFAGNNSSLGFSWTMGSREDRNTHITGPEGDIDGEGLFAFINCLGNNGDTAELYSPMVDISDLNKPEVSFAYHMFGVDIDTLHVDIFDGFQWYEDVVTIIGEQHTSATESWLDTTIKLDNFRNTDLVQLRFWSVRTGDYEMIALDNFSISDTVSCPMPLAFRMSGSTDSTATLTWETEAGAQDFLIEYGLSGYEYGQGTEIIVTSDSVVIPAADNLMYDAYLVRVCGAGDSSFFTGPVTFSSKVVPCDDMEAYPLGRTIFVNNQSSLFKSWNVGEDTGFSGEDPDARGDQEIDTLHSVSGSQSIHIYEGVKYGESSVVAFFDKISSGIHSVDLSIYVPDTGGGIYYFGHSSVKESFHFKGDSGICGVSYGAFGGPSPGSSGSLGTPIGSFPFGTGWTHMQHVFDLDRDSVWLIVDGHNIGFGWKTFSEFYSLESMRFMNTPSNLTLLGNGYNDYYLDDFCISPYVCPSPYELNLYQYTCTEASVSWIPGVQGSKMLITYDTTGFTPGTGNLESVVNTEKTISGLNPGGVYDIYIGEICGYDTVWTAPLTFTLPTEAIADFTFTQGNPTLNDLEVSFEGSTSVAAEGYTWDFGDGSTGSGAALKHTYTANGTYNVQLIIESDCGNDTISKIIEISGISLAENILEESLEIYPNPFTDKVYIEFETAGSEDVILTLTDLSGKIIMRRNIQDANGRFREEIDLDHLAKGGYLLKVESGSALSIRKLVKE